MADTSSGPETQPSVGSANQQPTAEHKRTIAEVKEKRKVERNASTNQEINNRKNKVETIANNLRPEPNPSTPDVQSPAGQAIDAIATGRIPAFEVITNEATGKAISVAVEGIINKACLIEAMKINGMGDNPDIDPVLQARLKRMGAPDLSNSSPKEKLAWQVAAFEEILEERGLDFKERIELAKADGLTDDEASKQVAAEIVNQRKAEINVYANQVQSPRLSVSVDEIIMHYQDDFNGIIKPESPITSEQLISLGISPEEFTKALEKIVPSGMTDPNEIKNYKNDDNVRTGVLRELFIKRYQDVLLKVGEEKINKIVTDTFRAKLNTEQKLQDALISRVKADRLAKTPYQLVLEGAAEIESIKDELNGKELFRDGELTDEALVIILQRLDESQFEKLLPAGLLSQIESTVAENQLGQQKKWTESLIELGIDPKDLNLTEADWARLSPEARKVKILDALRLNLERSLVGQLKSVENAALNSASGYTKEKFQYNIERTDREYGAVGELENNPVDVFRMVLELRKAGRPKLLRELAKSVSPNELSAKNKELIALAKDLKKEDGETDDQFILRRRQLHAKIALVQDAINLQNTDGGVKYNEKSNKGFDIDGKLKNYADKLKGVLEALDNFKGKNPNMTNLMKDMLVNGVDSETQKFLEETKKKLGNKALGLLLMILLALFGPLAKELLGTQ